MSGGDLRLRSLGLGQVDGLELSGRPGAGPFSGHVPRPAPPLASCGGHGTRPGRVTLTGPGRPKLLADFKLAPWGKDDWIEHLLGIEPEPLRLGADSPGGAGDGAEPPSGEPELWRIVLDRMAADVAIEGPRQRSRIELDACFHDRRARERTEAECLRLLLDWRPGPTREDRDVYGFSVDDPLTRLLRHQAIQLLLAANRFADNLARGAECNTLASSVRQDLIGETALQLADRPEAVAFLKHLIADSDERRHPLAASLLHALRIEWKPDQPLLDSRGRTWRRRIGLGSTSKAPTCGRPGSDARTCLAARFARARFDDAQLAGADLRTASIGEARFDRADLTQARLAKVQARVSRFEAACLRGADLELADLDGANFLNADLRGARLTLASMAGAILKHVKIEGADFTCANLSKAILSGLNLTEARFDNAWFAGAKLFRCNLEGMTLPHAIFAGAELAYALMTGSLMPDADFRDAYLCQAGLAEVEWERADLRNADLRGAAFHLGSSRSGLVGSPFLAKGAAPVSTPTTTTSRISRVPRRSAKPTSAEPTSEGLGSTESTSPGRPPRRSGRPRASSAPAPLRGDPRITRLNLNDEDEGANTSPSSPGITTMPSASGQWEYQVVGIVLEILRGPGGVVPLTLVWSDAVEQPLAGRISWKAPRVRARRSNLGTFCPCDCV